MRYLILTLLTACLLTTTLYAQSDKTAADVRSYEKGHWGIKITFPESWTVYREADVPEEFKASFGMPKIWSEKENADIENAVAISAYRSETLNTVEDVMRYEQKRVADILLSKKDVAVKNGMAFDSRTKINRVEYVSRKICRFENGIGYVLSFTATDGTFQQNLPAFERAVLTVSFEQPTKKPQLLNERNHYDLAREYYKFGPSHADKVITELQKHVTLETDDEKAFILLGTTQKGIGRYDDALKSFGEAEQIIRESKAIKPKLFMLVAECHFHKKEFQKARDTLQSVSGFFQDDSRQEAKYDSLMSAIIKQMEKLDK